MNLHKFYIDFTSEGYNFYTAVKKDRGAGKASARTAGDPIESNYKIEFEVEENGKNHSEGCHEK